MEETKREERERRICIVIPAHNEEKRIGQTLKEYGRFFHYVKEDVEILVIINNTQDATEDIVKQYQEQYPFIRYLNFKEGGKGFAIIEGFKEALKGNFDLIGFVDADLATSPEAYYDLINNIKEDGIIASRYLKESIVNPRQTLSRIFVSRIFNLLIRILFMMPYRDTQCGAKLFTSKSIESIIDRLKITQWAFDVNFLYELRKAGFKIKEHPTTWADKEYSKINFMNAGPRMALSIIRLRLVNSPFKFLVRLYDGLPSRLKLSYLLK